MVIVKTDNTAYQALVLVWLECGNCTFVDGLLSLNIVDCVFRHCWLDGGDEFMEVIRDVHLCIFICLVAFTCLPLLVTLF